jgi:hypothetical protein
MKASDFRPLFALFNNVAWYTTQGVFIAWLLEIPNSTNLPDSGSCWGQEQF